MWEAERERRQSESLVERRVDAMILLCVDPLQDFAALADMGIPVIVIDRPVVVKGAAAATEHFIENWQRSFTGAVQNELATREAADAGARPRPLEQSAS